MPKRDPVTIDHIWALHSHLDHTDAFDITFWCCYRLGELLIDAPFDPKAHTGKTGQFPTLEYSWEIT